LKLSIGSVNEVENNTTNKDDFILNNSYVDVENMNIIWLMNNDSNRAYDLSYLIQ